MIDSGSKGAPAEALVHRWEEHLRDEFVRKDADATIATMTATPRVNHVPVMTGGAGREPLRDFYAHHFIPQVPPDFEMVPVSRTVGHDRVVDEFVARFTHSIVMDWMLPGVAPTGRRVEIAMVVIVALEQGNIAHENIYWDQASVLVQIGLLDPAKLPVAGAASARKVLDPSLPSNELLARRAV
ncbi:Dienelactone hydrolase family protein [Minicystis rosea]|nr:Dienelactone hydrolase family protein [Minicystis rosea]